MSVFRRTMLVGAALIAPLSTAQAATLVQTSVIDRQTTDLDTGPILLHGFDSALGTLTGVQIDYGFALDSSGTFYNHGNTSEQFRFRSTYGAVFTFDGLESITDPYTLNFDTGEIVYGNIPYGTTLAFGPYQPSDTGTINPVDLDQFLDRDFSYSLYTMTGQSMIGGGGNINYGLRTYGEGFVRVTYLYDEHLAPAVPEPATWAMLLLGFGGVGAAMRRKRRKEMVRVTSC